MKKTILLLILVTFLLSSCDAGYNITSAGASDYDYALSVIQTSVPYIGGMDLRLDSIKLLETDVYGRRLFIYEMGLSSVSALLIIQKTAAPFVYYYEDFCYTIQNAEAEDFSADDKEVIKINNDWNEPLNESRMRSINYTEIPSDYENIDNYFDVCKLIQADIEQRHPENDWNNAKVLLNGMESYEGCGQIILVEIHYSDKNAIEYYLVLYNPAYDSVIREIETIDGIHNFQEKIKAFKDTYCR